MSNALISTIGLFADALGAGLLGYDLIRLQHRIRRDAAERRWRLDSLAEEYGGITAWAAEIKRSARWIPHSAYQRYHAEDPVSYNVQNLTEQTSELGDCVSALGEHVANLTTYLGEGADADVTTAAQSLQYSIVGLVLLFAGFIMQTLGTNL